MRLSPRVRRFIRENIVADARDLWPAPPDPRALIRARLRAARQTARAYTPTAAAPGPAAPADLPRPRSVVDADAARRTLTLTTIHRGTTPRPA